HPIARLDGCIRGETENTPAAAGTDDDRFRRNGLNLSGGHLQRHDSLNAAVVDQKFGYKVFVVASDGGVLERGLKKRMEHVEAGLVSGKPRPRLFHSPEGPNGNLAILLAAPWTAPMFEPHQLEWSLLDEGFYSVLITQPVAAGDRVVS